MRSAEVLLLAAISQSLFVHATCFSSLSLCQINICAFILVAEIINFAFHPNASDVHVHIDEWKWRLQLAFSAIPGLALLILSFIMHESPAYLQSLADQERLVNYGVGGGAGANGNGHLAAVVASDELGRTTPSYSDASAPAEKQGWGVLFSRQNIKWVAVGLILSSSNQLTGINAIIFYASVNKQTQTKTTIKGTATRINSCCALDRCLVLTSAFAC